MMAGFKGRKGGMISESWYWRTDLMKFASSLRKRASQKRWTDRSLCRCEQLIMIGFFYVRKLIDSRKLSRDFADRQIKLKAYPSIGKHVHLMNVHHHLDEFFDMGTHRHKTLKIEQIANQVIHSYIFYLDGGIRPTPGHRRSIRCCARPGASRTFPFVCNKDIRTRGEGRRR
ncbi:hypothetical protein SBA3_250025 [Candidatus Sulfopaludibacter sp. SbA3]|nr:hypothetical protein SBA3_250025 [Candidatus Sulfopaludibacter sp. SbA3]